MVRKGDAVRFVKGKYKGLTGWIDKDWKTEAPDSDYVGVVVVKKSGTEKATYVKRSSVRPVHKNPRCFEEAAIQQHKELEQALICFAELWVECGINNNDMALKFLNDEINAARDRQTKRGSKACYRWTNYKDSNANMTD
jgi:hypothetical protein